MRQGLGLKEHSQQIQSKDAGNAKDHGDDGNAEDEATDGGGGSAVGRVNSMFSARFLLYCRMSLIPSRLCSPRRLVRDRH